MTQPANACHAIIGAAKTGKTRTALAALATAIAAHPDAPVRIITGMDTTLFPILADAGVPTGTHVTQVREAWGLADALQRAVSTPGEVVLIDVDLRIDYEDVARLAMSYAAAVILTAPLLHGQPPRWTRLCATTTRLGVDA